MLNNVLFLIGEMTAPAIILAVAYFIWKSPPRYGGNGYRTKRSKSSEQAWLFAQVTYGKLATVVFGAFTALTLIVGVIGILMNFDVETGFAVFIAQNIVLVILLIVVIAAVEKKLAETFDENGDPG